MTQTIIEQTTPPSWRDTPINDLNARVGDDLSPLIDDLPKVWLETAPASNEILAAVGATSLSAEISNLQTRPPGEKKEVYKGSLVLFKDLGRVMLDAEGVDAPEIVVKRELLRTEMRKTAAEVIKISPELREFVEITDVEEYPVVDDKVMTKDGEREMTELVETGAESSRWAAEQDPRMKIQHTRDCADRSEAYENDTMVAGRTAHNTRVAVTMEPRDALKKHPKYWNDKGYRDGFAFIRGSHAHGNKLVSINASMDHIKEETFLQVLAEQGVDVPHGTDPNSLIEHAIRRKLGSGDEALAFVIRLRKRCYEIQGDTRIRQSATDFVETHRRRIDQAIDALCDPLSESVVSKQKHPAIQLFVKTLLQNPKDLNDETIAELRGIQEREDFDDERCRFMVGLAMYAVAEHVRDDALQLRYAAPKQINQTEAQVWVAANPTQLVHNLALGVLTGAEAGRSHGGPCPGMVTISNKGDGPGGAELDPQAPYGGRDKSDEHCVEMKDGDIVKCPNCRKIVKLIVVNKEKLYCSNLTCALAPEHAKRQARMDAKQARKDYSATTVVSKKSKPKKSQLAQAA